MSRSIKRSRSSNSTEVYSMPTVEEIATNVSGAQGFTVFDVKSGFWHIPLNEEST